MATVAGGVTAWYRIRIMSVVSPWTPAPATACTAAGHPVAVVGEVTPAPDHASLSARLMAGAALGLTVVGMAGCGAAAAAPIDPPTSTTRVYDDPEGDRVTVTVDRQGNVSETVVNVDGDVFVRHGDPGAIGRIADQCKQDAVHGRPTPCAEVHLNDGPAGDHGYVILKANRFPDEFLTIPTAPLTGIEDPGLTGTAIWQRGWMESNSPRIPFSSSTTGLPASTAEERPARTMPGRTWASSRWQSLEKRAPRASQASSS